MKIRVPEAEDTSRVQICVCGHPADEHYPILGCQSAISHRAESKGGGVGSSFCRCPMPDVIAEVPRRYVQRFRSSPLKMHALGAAVASMQKAGALGEIDWDESRIKCRAENFQCTGDEVEPVYRDLEGQETILVCEYHARLMVASSNAFRHVRYTRSIKAKRSKQDVTLRNLLDGNEAELRKRGLVSE